MVASFPRQIAQGCELHAEGSEIWRCYDSGTQAGIRCLGRRRKGLATVLQSQTLLQHRSIHGQRKKEIKKGRNGRMKKGEGRGGGGTNTCSPAAVVVRSVPVPRQSPTPVAVVVAFESCMLTMRTECEVGLRPHEKGTDVCC